MRLWLIIFHVQFSSLLFEQGKVKCMEMKNQCNAVFFFFFNTGSNLTHQASWSYFTPPPTPYHHLQIPILLDLKNVLELADCIFTLLVRTLDSLTNPRLILGMGGSKPKQTLQDQYRLGENWKIVIWLCSTLLDDAKCAEWEYVSPRHRRHFNRMKLTCIRR